MIEYTEEIKGILAVQLYQTQECRAIVESAGRASSWAPARVSVRLSADGFNPMTRPAARRASVLAPNFESEIKRDFDARMESVIKPLVKEVWRVDLKRHAETHFVRYAPGHYYTPHSDTGPDRTDRYFTVLCYLNEEFGGGRTDFPRLSYAIEPRAGKAIIFPATYMHCAEPVLDGEKYVLVSWLVHAPPIRWI